MGDIVKLDAQYSQWIKDISTRFRQSQIKAACRVNQELLKFYWELGREISIKEKENEYGMDFYNKLSLDLGKELPEVRSFSVTNLRYMKYFYELYPDAEIYPQVVDNSDHLQNLPQVGDNSGLPQIPPQVGDNSKQLIFSIPWGHNKLIIDKCKNNPDKALFFVKETLENNWSRAVLLNFLDTDLYERKGKAISNFNRALPDAQNDLALEMTKDPYNFDFLIPEEFKSSLPSIEDIEKELRDKE